MSVTPVRRFVETVSRRKTMKELGLVGVDAQQAFLRTRPRTEPAPDVSPQSWQGKRPPSYCQPLTVEWFAGAMKPIYDEGGDVVRRTLTPPPRHHSSGSWLRVLAVLAFFASLAAAFTWPLWGR